MKSRRSSRKKPELSHLPSCPGAYLMKDPEGKVLYVGKANNLVSRVRSHFSRPKSAFVPYVNRVEYIAAENGGEALLLEYNLIKKYKPPFNIRLRDDKRYPYIKLTLGEKWPRAYLTRSYMADGSKYFGPYPNVKAARMTLNAIKEIFPYRGCKYKSRQFPLPRPCIDYDMKRCVGPCIDAVTEEEYRELCQEVIKFLKGRHDEVRKAVEEKMHQASARMLYEKAGAYRDILQSIDALSERQIVTILDRSGRNQEHDEDYLALARCGNVTTVGVLKKRKGSVIGTEFYFLDGPEDEPTAGKATDEAVIEAFIPQYYDQVSDLPYRVVLPFLPDSKRELGQFLSDRADHRVELYQAQRGNKRQTLEMAGKNARLRAEQYFRKVHGLKGRIEPAVEELQRLLGLPRPPVRIEGYDISNISGTDAVGSMVVLHRGKPQRSSYRKFKIRQVEGVDDYAMMQEMLRRRLKRKEDSRFGSWPDLFLIDGGRGHLNAVLEVFREFQMEGEPVISIAKQEELIFTPDKMAPIRLEEKSAVLKMLQRLRDEAHRFAITYHRKLRTQKISRSVLEDIEGLGEKRKYSIIRYFGSIEAIRSATVEEISAVPGISLKLAEKIHGRLEEY